MVKSVKRIDPPCEFLGTHHQSKKPVNPERHRHSLSRKRDVPHLRPWYTCALQSPDLQRVIAPIDLIKQQICVAECAKGRTRHAGVLRDQLILTGIYIDAKDALLSIQITPSIL